MNVMTDGNGNVTISIPAQPNQNLAGQYISATATDSTGNTSEFSKDFIAT
jgi:hypothetical protein